MIYAIGDIIPKALSFIVFPILTTYLSPSDYGIVNYVNSLNLLLFIVGLLSLNTYYLVYYFRKDDSAKRRLLGSLTIFVISINIIFVLLCMLVGKLFPTVFSSNIDFYPYIFIGLLTNFFNLFSVFPSALYRMQERPIALTILNVGKGLLTTILTVVLVVSYRGDALSVLASNLVVTAVFAVIFMYITSKNMVFCIDKVIIKEGLKFSIPLIPGSIAYFLLSVSDRFFIERSLTLNDLGIYSTAVTLATILNIVINGAYKAFEPYIYKIYGSDDFDKKFDLILNTLITAVVIIGFGISLFSKEFFQIFASEKYQTVYLYVPLSVVSLVISSATVVYSTLLCAQDRTKQNSLATMIGGITSVIFNLLLIPVCGLYGSCAASIVAFLVILLISIKATGCTITSGLKRIILIFFICCLIVYALVYIGNIGNDWMLGIIKVVVFLIVSIPLGLHVVKTYRSQI